MEKAHKLDELIDGAEELLTKLADAHNPEIRNLRDRVDDAIIDAQRAIARQTDDAAVQLRDLANTIDGCVRDYPWLAVAVGVVVAGTTAFIAGATIGANKRSKRAWI